MKYRNHVITSKNQDDLKRLKEEYEMLGRYCTISEGTLTVFALDPRHGKRKH